MHAGTRRSKKLIVAFHFQFANQAAWRCDECRRAGLERRRRCGWAGLADAGSERIVWGRREMAVTQCPKSAITSESLYLLEEFGSWTRASGRDPREMPARVVDAILLLENEVRKEQIRAKQERHGQPERQ